MVLFLRAKFVSTLVFTIENSFMSSLIKLLLTGFSKVISAFLIFPLFLKSKFFTLSVLSNSRYKLLFNSKFSDDKFLDFIFVQKFFVYIG